MITFHTHEDDKLPVITKGPGGFICWAYEVIHICTLLLSLWYKRDGKQTHSPVCTLQADRKSVPFINPYISSVYRDMNVHLCAVARALSPPCLFSISRLRIFLVQLALGPSLFCSILLSIQITHSDENVQHFVLQLFNDLSYSCLDSFIDTTGERRAGGLL